MESNLSKQGAAQPEVFEIRMRSRSARTSVGFADSWSSQTKLRVSSVMPNNDHLDPIGQYFE